MDNLTHSLTGAVLGQMGLKTKTGLGMATLIIAANIPDIDAVAVLLDGHQHLAIRRGITHGPIALLLLPLILTGLMIGFDRWQTNRGQRPANRLPIHKGWLLALAYIGTISHPAMDWLNSYGVRFLEPFSSQWFYGDSIFIIDIWIWIALIAGVWISRRREKKTGGNWQRPAWIAFTAVSAYIFANGVITGKAEADAEFVLDNTVDSIDGHGAEVVANPIPIQFWKREILWRNEKNFGSGTFGLFERLSLKQEQPIPEFNKFLITEITNSSPDASAYLFWSRMPIVTSVGVNITIRDQRFLDPLVGDRFTVKTSVPKDRLAEKDFPSKERK